MAKKEGQAKFDATDENINSLSDKDVRYKMQLGKILVDLMMKVFPNVLIMLSDAKMDMKGKLVGDDGYSMTTLSLNGCEGLESKKLMLEVNIMEIIKSFYEKCRDDLLVSPNMATYFSLVTMAGYMASENDDVEDVFDINETLNTKMGGTGWVEDWFKSLSDEDKKKTLELVMKAIKVKDGSKKNSKKTAASKPKSKGSSRKNCKLEDAKTFGDLPKNIRDRIKNDVNGSISDHDDIEVLFAGNLDENTQDILEKMFRDRIKTTENSKGELTTSAEIKYDEMTDDQIDALSKALGIDIRKKVKEVGDKHGIKNESFRIGAITMDDDGEEDDDD